MLRAFRSTFFANSLPDVLLVEFLLVRHDLFGQALRQVASLRVLVNHVIESSLHFRLDLEGLALHIFHLLLDCCDAFLKNRGIEHASIREHIADIRLVTGPHLMSPAATGKRVALHNHDFLQLFDLGLNACAASLSVLVQQLHVIELLIQRYHHFQHHTPVFVEYVLFD